MFMSATDLEFDGDHLDLSFQDAEAWGRDPRSDLSILKFAIGDPERGAIVGLFDQPGKPGDEQKFPPIIHMHRSDSFRTIFNSDFYVGRKLYADGKARLQRGGRYYGPEQLGPQCCRNSETAWAVLVVGDKRGHEVHPADEKYLEMLNYDDPTIAGEYAKLGVEAFPVEDKGRTDIRSNIGLKIAAHADLSFDEAQSWPLIGKARTAAMSLGETDCGPIVLAVSAPPGAAVLPALTWKTEIVTMVIHGECETGGHRYLPGDMRVQAAGALQGAVIAGPEGMNGYVVVGDRRAAPAADDADPAAAAWVCDFLAHTAPFSEPKEARARLAAA